MRPHRDGGPLSVAFSRAFMTLSELQREIAALPSLAVETAEGEAVPEETTPLQLVARQGRVILRLSAATESVEKRYHELAERLAERDGRIEELSAARREAEKRARQAALEAVHLMDALDWARDALEKQGHPLAKELAAAQRDCLSRMAALGIRETPGEGLMDGRLHEGVDTVETDAVPRYHIVSVVRRGYQWGADVLRRAEVITAA
jgi:molecular chaperone GrpE (heat shock protein)